MDSKRNAALSAASSYHNKSQQNAKYDLYNLMKKVTDELPLFNQGIADKLALRQLDIARKTTLDSIHGQIQLQQDLDIAGCLKYAKTNKKDALYKWILRRV